MTAPAAEGGGTKGGTKRVARWYHGGLASATAAMCTHPLDLLKVHLQTQQKVQLGLVGMSPPYSVRSRYVTLTGPFVL